jgi:hypothetical protein
MAFTKLTIDPATGIREITAQGASAGQYFTNGRNAVGRFATWDATCVTVTARGHWYRSDDPMDGFSNDRLCRGCGHHGHFDYILDYEPCPRPATARNVVMAFKRTGIRVGDRVSLAVSSEPDDVVGTVKRLYNNVIDVSVADVELPGGEIFPQNVVFLTRVGNESAR